LDIKYIKKIRGTWGGIKPITRIHDNGLKKDKKKLRREGKQIIKSWRGL
jgi:hypothetical protein